MKNLLNKIWIYPALVIIFNILIILYGALFNIASIGAYTGILLGLSTDPIVIACNIFLGLFLILKKYELKKFLIYYFGGGFAFANVLYFLIQNISYVTKLPYIFVYFYFTSLLIFSGIIIIIKSLISTDK